jgi:hypothetical protein
MLLLTSKHLKLRHFDRVKIAGSENIYGDRYCQCIDVSSVVHVTLSLDAYIIRACVRADLRFVHALCLS